MRKIKKKMEQQQRTRLTALDENNKRKVKYDVRKLKQRANKYIENPKNKTERNLKATCQTPRPGGVRLSKPDI